MAGPESDTIGGSNSMLQKQKALPGECRITTVLFDDRYELLHDRIHIRAVSPITRNTAEGYRAENVMFVSITDGEEDASREFSSQRAKAMIEKDILCLGQIMVIVADVRHTLHPLVEPLRECHPAAKKPFPGPT